MNEPVIVIGAGGHARVLCEALRLMGVRILGVTDTHQDKASRGMSYLGSDEIISKYPPHEIQLVNSVGSTKVSTKRRKIFEGFKMKGYRFFSVIHPSAVIAQDVEMGEGVQIMAGSVIQPGTKIGDNAIVNTKASVDHDCVIGAHAHIAPGAVVCGSVSVGEGVHLGAGSVVVQGVHIGAYRFIHAASLQGAYRFIHAASLVRKNREGDAAVKSKSPHLRSPR